MLVDDRSRAALETVSLVRALFLSIAMFVDLWTTLGVLTGQVKVECQGIGRFQSGRFSPFRLGPAILPSRETVVTCEVCADIAVQDLGTGCAGQVLQLAVWERGSLCPRVTRGGCLG